MKFANLKFTKYRTGTANTVNIGDDMQILAIDHLYKLMGIPSDDIIIIEFSEISTYKGDYCILPISFPFQVGYQNEFNITNFSPYIIPVFLGISIRAQTLSDIDVEYLKKFQPIGCRDEYTMNILRRYNIMAYFNGCMTVTLPYAENNKHDEIYMVDIPEKYYSYIPEDIRQNAKKISHIIDDCEVAEKRAEEYFEMYSQHARLVITTRLHCANPCIAAGIPVIFMMNRFSYRYSALSKCVNIYAEDQFENIDWNPVANINVQEKKKMIEVAKNRIMSAYEQYRDIFDISFYNENKREHCEVCVDEYCEAVEFINNKWDKKDSFSYAFWGITQRAELIYQYIRSHYNNAKLTGVYDNKKTGKWHDVEIEKSSEIEKKCGEFIFVTATSAFLSAKRLFENLSDNKRIDYYGYSDGINLSSEADASS